MYQYREEAVAVLKYLALPISLYTQNSHFLMQSASPLARQATSGACLTWQNLFLWGA